MPARLATDADNVEIGRLLDDFNREYGQHSPGPAVLGRRIRELVAGGDTAVLLVGDGPEGIAVLRLRPAIWSHALECYLAEIYVVPARRGQGLGRELLQAVLDHARDRGADRIDLDTSVADVGAIRLYERMGFTNREAAPDGPVMLCYERDL